MHYFYKVRQKSKYPEYVGKYYGWVTAGKCKMQTEKEQPIKHYLKALGKQGIDYTEYVGICADSVLVYSVYLAQLQENDEQRN